MTTRAARIQFAPSSVFEGMVGTLHPEDQAITVSRMGKRGPSPTVFFSKVEDGFYRVKLFRGGWYPIYATFETEEEAHAHIDAWVARYYRVVTDPEPPTLAQGDEIRGGRYVGTTPEGLEWVWYPGKPNKTWSFEQECEMFQSIYG